MTVVRGDARRSLGELLRDAAQGTNQLIRQEGRLTLLESKRLAGHVMRGTGMIALGGVLLLLGVIVLITGVILLLGYEWLRGEYWLAALIVTVVLGIIAAALAIWGRSFISSERLEPDETLATLKEDKEWLKRQLTSDVT
ncbi:MAG TPA: phage holin family protein [Gemmatimonadaceae bacterium]|nr:phage holin family protein [Gemmatimonadaceae bacterium]